MVVFATQSVIKNPPFTRLDLLSCRNLLIYLEPELQERLIPTFQYALKSGGVLFLGPSESVGKFQDLFNTVNRKWKVFKIKQNVPSVRVIMPKQPAQITKEAGTYPAVPKKAALQAGFTERTTKVLFQSYVPPSVITNEKGDIFYLYGDTGKYLLTYLESRLDNVVYRLGFGDSRNQARQLVRHGHFKVNDRRADVPSYMIKAGDVITWRPSSTKTEYYKTLAQEIGVRTIPGWLALDKEKMTGKVLSLPAPADIEVKFDAKVIVEYYSR